METKANHILIGAFILLATIIGFAFVFWIQNYGTGTSINRYQIVFKGPVTGLAPASTVLFNGLKVGKIERFEIDPVDPRITRVFVTVKKNIPVRRNSYARIVSQGLSAYSSVMITPGTPDEELLVMRDDGKLPVINAAPGGSSASLFEAAPKVLDNVNTVLRRVDELIANNEQLVRDTLKNIERFTAELDRNKGKITSLMINADKALVTADEAAKKASAAMTRVDKLIAANENEIKDIIASIGVTSKNAEKFSAMLANKESDVAAIIDNVRSMSVQFKGVAAKLETALDGVSSLLSNDNGTSMMNEISLAATSFRSLAEKLDKSLGNSADGMARFAKSGLKEFEGLMREGRRMVKAMERVMNNLERNPQGLIFGAKQVREYKSN
ncbi:MAG: MCE family protein [bacterium]|nr:MCE family protein [bacterium]